MSRTIERIQRGALLKSCLIVFAPQAIIVVLVLPFFVPLNVLQSLRVPIIGVNAVVSAVVGWRLYRSREHIVFSYDTSQYSVRKGHQIERHRWSEFRRVSLAKSEHGEFFVRLYKNDDDYYVIPVTKLSLDPFSYRHEAMRLVSEWR